MHGCRHAPGCSQVKDSLVEGEVDGAGMRERGILAGQQLFAVGFGLDLLTLDDVFDDAFLVDEEGGADGAEVLAAVHRLRASP